MKKKPFFTPEDFDPGSQTDLLKLYQNINEVAGQTKSYDKNKTNLSLVQTALSLTNAAIESVSKTGRDTQSESFDFFDKTDDAVLLFFDTAQFKGRFLTDNARFVNGKDQIGTTTRFFQRTWYANLILAPLIRFRLESQSSVIREPYAFKDFDKSILKATRRVLSLDSDSRIPSTREAALVRSALTLYYLLPELPARRQAMEKIAFESIPRWIQGITRATRDLYATEAKANSTHDLLNPPLFRQNYIRRSWKLQYDGNEIPKFSSLNTHLVNNPTASPKSLRNLETYGKGQIEFTADKFIRMVPADAVKTANKADSALEHEFLKRFNARFLPENLACVMMKVPPGLETYNEDLTKVKFDSRGNPNPARDLDNISLSLISSSGNLGSVYGKIAGAYQLRQRFFSESRSQPALVYGSKPRFYASAANFKSAFSNLGVSAINTVLARMDISPEALAREIFEKGTFGPKFLENSREAALLFDSATNNTTPLTAGQVVAQFPAVASVLAGSVATSFFLLNGLSSRDKSESMQASSRQEASNAVVDAQFSTATNLFLRTLTLRASKKYPEDSVFLWNTVLNPADSIDQSNQFLSRFSKGVNLSELVTNFMKESGNLNLFFNSPYFYYLKAENHPEILTRDSIADLALNSFKLPPMVEGATQTFPTKN